MSSKETILVTGGAGFIGSHLVERLLAQGRRVVILDNFDDFYDPEIKRRNIQGLEGNGNFKLIEGDIRDITLLNKVFDEYEITKVIHLAARAGVRASLKDPVLYEEVNVKGTLNVLEACRVHGVENFLFASSSSVYGANGKVPFREDDEAIYPISPYAATKRAAELLCWTYHNLYEIPISILRFFTVYGPRQRPEMAIHKFTRLIDQGKPVPVYGDGTSRRDYTFITDIIDGIVSALDRPYPFEIFNLGNSKTVELRHLISLIEEALGKRAQIKALPPQPGDVPITYASIEKAEKMLGYNPQVEIKVGIKKFVNWYKTNLTD